MSEHDEKMHLIVESMVTDFLHGIPIVNKGMFNGVLQGQEASLSPNKSPSIPSPPSHFGTLGHA